MNGQSCRQRQDVARNLSRPYLKQPHLPHRSSPPCYPSGPLLPVSSKVHRHSREELLWLWYSDSDLLQVWRSRRKSGALGWVWTSSSDYVSAMLSGSKSGSSVHDPDTAFYVNVISSLGITPRNDPSTPLHSPYISSF
jgi:hypothetical protein